MSSRIDSNGLSIARELYDLVNQEIIPGTGVDSNDFWAGFAKLITDLAPKNRALLEKRTRIQAQLNEWHKAHPGAIEFPAYKQFLTDIGYLVPEGDDFEILGDSLMTALAAEAGVAHSTEWSSSRSGVDVVDANDSESKTLKRAHGGAGGHDPDEVQGFAFGIGIDRLAACAPD